MFVVFNLVLDFLHNSFNPVDELVKFDVFLFGIKIEFLSRQPQNLVNFLILQLVRKQNEREKFKIWGLPEAFHGSCGVNVHRNGKRRHIVRAALFDRVWLSSPRRFDLHGNFVRVVDEFAVATFDVSDWAVALRFRRVGFHYLVLFGFDDAVCMRHFRNILQLAVDLG